MEESPITYVTFQGVIEMTLIHQKIVQNHKKNRDYEKRRNKNKS